MKVADRKQFILALENGIGFTMSCALCLISPESTSKYIKKNKPFHIQCIEAIKSAANTNLEYANRLKHEQKIREWQNQLRLVKDFIMELTLWEDYCKRSDVTDVTITRAANIYKTADECATALGFTKKDFIEHCFSRENLIRYLQDSNKYNF